MASRLHKPRSLSFPFLSHPPPHLPAIFRGRDNYLLPIFRKLQRRDSIANAILRANIIITTTIIIIILIEISIFFFSATRLDLRVSNSNTSHGES
jgi:hypothetical protein